MTYNEFKNYIYKRLQFDFNFKKAGKLYFYQNDEVKFIVQTQKSNYGNDAYINVGITSKDVLDHWKLDEPTSFETSRIYTTFRIDKTMYNLDEVQFAEIDVDMNYFFSNIFPCLLSTDDIKSFYINKKEQLMPYLRDFWYKSSN